MGGARQGLAWLGLDWQSMAGGLGRGMARHGSVGQIMAGSF